MEYPHGYTDEQYGTDKALLRDHSEHERSLEVMLHAVDDPEMHEKVTRLATKQAAYGLRCMAEAVRIRKPQA